MEYGGYSGEMFQVVGLKKRKEGGNGFVCMSKGCFWSRNLETGEWIVVNRKRVMEHCEKSHNDDKSGLILVCHKQGVFSESPITLAEAIKMFPRDFKSWRAKALVEACHQSAPLEFTPEIKRDRMEEEHQSFPMEEGVVVQINQQELNLPLQASRLGRLQSDEKIALKVALWDLYCKNFISSEQAQLDEFLSSQLTSERTQEIEQYFPLPKVLINTINCQFFFGNIGRGGDDKLRDECLNLIHTQKDLSPNLKQKNVFWFRYCTTPTKPRCFTLVWMASITRVIVKKELFILDSGLFERGSTTPYGESIPDIGAKLEKTGDWRHHPLNSETSQLAQKFKVAESVFRMSSAAEVYPNHMNLPRELQ